MDIEGKLKRLKWEDLIWIIYFFIAAAALFSNQLDREFLLKKDYNAYKKEKNINITIFVIAFFIYLYFFLLAIDDLNSIESKFNDEKFRNNMLRLIGALFFLIGGIIYLYLEVTTNDAFDVGIIS